ncbi:hypothetical protein CAEBREN_11578 [Caenorhabditis brenneri]|uniref:Uncharacterized protein n=1 Tax=Caenorhabditis brenneri TaxID=135651 RepID=G0MX69_CAEBE|nr:hypothetical protein CAEBREN_11578 [Caenorhabditis brenneri]
MLLLVPKVKPMQVPIPPDNLQTEFLMDDVRVLMYTGLPETDNKYNMPAAIALDACTLYNRTCTYLESDTKQPHRDDQTVRDIREVNKPRLEYIVTQASLPFKKDLSHTLIELFYGCIHNERIAEDFLGKIKSDHDRAAGIKSSQQLYTEERSGIRIFYAPYKPDEPPKIPPHREYKQTK